MATFKFTVTAKFLSDQGSDNIVIRLRASSEALPEGASLAAYQSPDCIEFSLDPIKAQDFDVGKEITVTVEPSDD